MATQADDECKRCKGCGILPVWPQPAVTTTDLIYGVGCRHCNGTGRNPVTDAEKKEER